MAPQQPPQMVYMPKRVNHLLHLILTILTGGIWGLVWIVLAIKTPSVATQVRRATETREQRKTREWTGAMVVIVFAILVFVAWGIGQLNSLMYP